MNKKKVIIAAIVIALVLSIGGVIAYFTDTDTATNTFTIGNIDISLSEDHWVAANGQNIMPGAIVAKDPVINNDSTASSAYVFMEVEIPCTEDTTPAEMFTLNSVSNDWYLMTNGTCSSGKATKVYAYGSSSAMTSLAAGTSTPALFSSVTLSNAIDEDTSLPSSIAIKVTGYGIQTEGVSPTTPSSVWGNF